MFDATVNTPKITSAINMRNTMNLKRAFVYLSCFVCLATFCIGQTAVVMPPPKIQFLDANGRPLSGGCVNTYAAGTTTNQATYKDSTGSAVNTNPVILDSAGRASIFTTRGVLYKVVVTSAGGANCSTGTLQYTQDNIPSGSSLVVGGANGQVQYNGFGTLAASPTFTWNNGSGTLSVPALNTTSGGFLGGSFAGNPIWTGTHSFNGPVSFPGGLVGSPTITNAGIYTNTQQNLYLQSLLNGCNPTTQWSSVFTLPNHATEAGTFCSVISSGATVFQNNVVGSYVENQNGATTAGVAVFGMATASTTIDGRVWGANFLATDVAGTKSQNLYSQENDCNILAGNTTSVCHGLLISGFWKAQPTVSMGIEIGQLQQGAGCTTCVWPYGIKFDDAATAAPSTNGAAVYFGPVAASTSQVSQGVTFLSNSSGGTHDRSVTVNEDILGNLFIVNSAASTGILLNGSQVTRATASGAATVDLASVASAACTADSADVTLTGAVVGDPVRVTAATALPAGVWLIGRVTASNTGRFQLCNLSGGAVDRASDTYTISVVK